MPRLGLALPYAQDPMLLPLSLALMAPAPQLRPDLASYELVPEIIVGLAPGVTSQEFEGGGLVVAAENSAAGRALLRFEVPPTLAEYETMLGALAGDTRLNFVEPNRRISTVESDGCENVQPGALSCTIAFFDGDPDTIKYYDQPAVAAIDVEPVWSMIGSMTSVVAVIDTGIDPTHEVLADRLYDLGWDFITGAPAGIDLPNMVDDDGDGLVDEAYGHGTHVAGTIALINPAARILPLRVLDSDGNGSAWHVAEAIEYATLVGAQHINLSLGMRQRSEAVAQAIRFAHQNEVQVVASAGNTAARRVLFPGRHPGTIAVAATDNVDVLAEFSAYGERVDVCAPGVDIYGPMPEGQYAWWSGCSMATAVATGAASLLYVVHGEEPDETAHAMLDFAVDIDPLNPTAEGGLGEGRIDALSAANDLNNED